MNQLDPIAEVLLDFGKEQRKIIKQLFSGRITGNFLLEIMNDVLHIEMANGELLKYFNAMPDPKNLLSGNIEQFDYEVCRYIVGAHRFNVLFLPERERAKLESDKVYRLKLESEVITHIRLRPVAGSFFRKKQIMQGDEFLFYNLPYDLFALSIVGNSIVHKTTNFKEFYAGIFAKSTAILSLLEDNFTDNSFAICRSVIELYVKLLMLANHPESKKMHDEFVQYDLKRNISGMEWPEEFLERFKKRKWQSKTAKGDYLHFGFVDDIPDYFEKVGDKFPYSISGALQYLSQIYGEEQGSLFADLQTYYSFCNGYAHGNTLSCMYPLNDYFNVVAILAPIVQHTYLMACEEAQVDGKINDIDVVEKTRNDYAKTMVQYTQRTKENFEAYYKRK